MLLYGIQVALAGLFLGTVLFAIRDSIFCRRLPHGESLNLSPAWEPTCSIVIPCRDEGERVRGTLKRLLAQRGVSIEVIVVDDRSSDSTRRILAQCASENPRIKVVRIDQLPDGWLGKCHACHVGASQATGEWILFTDSDCWLGPRVVRRALAVAHKDHAAMVALTPGIPGDTLSTQAWHLAFLLSVSYWIRAVNLDQKGAHFGMGAFNLVRADVYRACGGYETLKLSVVDDVKLGFLVRRTGSKIRAFLGGEDALCDWGGSILGMIKVMEKNYYAALEYRLFLALAAGFLGLSTCLVALCAPLFGGMPGLILFACYASLIVPAALFARKLGWGVGGALLTPLALPLLFVAILWSTWVTTRQGGVRWRDTFYSLKTLRGARLS